MATNSYTSSMSAQNGSSSSNSLYPSDSASQTVYPGSSYAATPAAEARYPSGPPSARNPRTHLVDNGYGPRSQPPAINEQPVYEQQNDTYSTHQEYYLSSPVYYPPAEPTTYENELDLEEDQNEGLPSTPVYGQSSYSNNSGVYTQPTFVPQSYSTGQATSAGSTYLPPDPTQRWQREQSTEERLRLGLPRHQPGQQTPEYQQAEPRYESTHPSRR